MAVSIVDPRFSIKRSRIADSGTFQELQRLTTELDSLRESIAIAIVDITTANRLPEGSLGSDPPDPDPGYSVMWQSDGTGTGSDGDVLIKITDTLGTTKVATLVDFSAI